MGALGALSLALSAVGLYSVMTYAANERNHEIGIRMALGAPHSDVLGMVLRDGMGMTLTGILLGAVAAAVVTRVVASMLVGVGSVDPLSFTGAAFFVCMVALLAWYLPARRATKVEPMSALRSQ